LKNAVVSAYHAATDEVITSADLPGYLYATDVDDSLVRTNQPLPQEQEPVEPPSCPLSLHKMEEDSIRAALEKTDYNVARAAELLEISKATLYRKLKEYHLTH
jgi:DNA-binding NtrC family response regulator